MAIKNKISKVEKIKPKYLITALVSVFIIAVIITAVSISNNGRRHETVTFDTPVATGIDVSEHNKGIDWKAVKEDFDFAFVRVGYRGYTKGNIQQDETAKDNLKGAEKAGVPVGVYFYTQAITEEEAKEEAQFLLDFIKHYNVSLPVIIDFEYAFDSSGNHAGRLFEANLTPDEKADIINAFFKTVKKEDYSYGIYASSYMLEHEISSHLLDDSAIIWVADYNENVTYDIDYTIWQYSKTGESDAVGSKYVDLNYWYTD